MSKKYVQRGPKLWAPIPEEPLGLQIYDSLVKATAADVAYIDVVTGKTLLFDNFFDLTSRLAESLQNCGYGFNDVMSICSENNNYFFIPVVSGMYLGMIIAPLNCNYSQGELLHAVNISKPKILFCSKKVLETFLKLKDKLAFIEKIILIEPQTLAPGLDNIETFISKHCGKSFKAHNFKPVNFNTFDTVAVILCSSGTTGLPKGVMITHDNISTRINHAYDPRFQIVSEEIIFGVLPFFHAYGFFTCIAALIKRNKVIILDRFEENLFLSCIEKYRISNLSLVPPLMLFLARSPIIAKYDLSSVVEIVCGAAPLSAKIEAEVKMRLPNVKTIRQGYGQTEVTIVVLLMPIGEHRAGSSGKVLPGISCIVRDVETENALGPNQVGELCFKGRIVMKGYYGNEEATREAFTKDGWLLSGDLGYYDEDGYFYIVDRLKELIKYKGFQVPPAELEALLLTHPNIKDAGVIGVPHDEIGELAFAFIVKESEDYLSEEEVKRFVAERVSRPKHLHGGVIFVNEIPRNPSGKILRRQLRELVKKYKSKL